MNEEERWRQAAILTKQMNMPRPITKPKVDVIVSKIVGKTIYMTDPRLLKLVMKWKRAKQGGEDEDDNFLKDPRKVQELKDVLGGNL